MTHVAETYDFMVPGFRFRKGATKNAAEAYGVKAVMFTAKKPEPADGT